MSESFSRHFLPPELLVDRGFDAEFSWDRLNTLCAAFAPDATLERLIAEAHAQDGVCDLKRGEYYPEILRAVATMKRAASLLFAIEPIQAQPNLGSNGSIDTILTAAKLREARGKRNPTAQPTAAASPGEAEPLPPDSRLPEQAGASGGVLLTSPTYFRNYNSATARDLKTNFVPLKEDYNLDTSNFIVALHLLQPDVVFIVTPNNPTGIPIEDRDICRILDALPEHTWAIMDRTLVNARPEVATKELLRRYAHKNLVILHSFSKYRGMSHLRIGIALYSNPIFAREVQPCLPLGVGLEGCLKATSLMLQEGGVFPGPDILSNIRRNRETLDALTQRCSEFKITDFSSNYCLLILPANLRAEEVTATLAQEGLFVMGGHEFPEPNPRVLRLHTGAPPDGITRLCAVLAARYQSAAPAALQDSRSDLHVCGIPP